MLAALVAGAALWPEPAPDFKVPLLSPRAFSSHSRELTSSKYAGSCLVIFTQNRRNATAARCQHCDELHDVLDSEDFKRKAAGWKARDLLRLGKVYCDKYEELCERFGVTGSAGTEFSLPHIIWFKGGKEIGAFDGTATVSGFVDWVKMKQDVQQL